ncbi:hypothetical protein AAL_08283 [Moelleriella libera RCEF 2490]|uniref:Rhodopsin domain-containing protein n=1 Tax=Moelleriella libera RCEF 2490 TaxID=1081109 RepID=A0A166N592_9HYPO|nr:hypothetical protein AAL_08283 [Moelleriella libera RCEF 2490]
MERPIATPDDMSSVPVIISWVITVAVALCVVAKLVIKYTSIHRLELDDAFILLSLTFSVAMLPPELFASRNGLGKRQASLSMHELQVYQKSVYAADALFILTLFCSKSAILLLLRNWSINPLHRALVYAATAYTAVWALSALLIALFRCSLPRPWAILGDTCLNQEMFWESFGVLHTLAEAFLLALPIVIIARARISSRQKASIASIFALRIFVIGAIAAEMSYRYRARFSNDDTHARWPVAVCITLVQGMNLIFSCVPWMKQFFVSLESGMIRVDDKRRLEAGK